MNQQNQKIRALNPYLSEILKILHLKTICYKKNNYKIRTAITGFINLPVVFSMQKQFNNCLADSQSTKVLPIKPENFDIECYEAYAVELNKPCAVFWKKGKGVVVYRRMRMPDFFMVAVI